MELSKILDLLKSSPEDECFPLKVIESAIEREEEITPFLIQELQKSVENPKLLEENEHYMLPFYAMFLLAKFRNKEAFSYILKFMTWESDLIYLIFGDIVTESLNSLLASTYHDNLDDLVSFIKNDSYCQWARGGVSKSLVTLWVNGILTRDQIQEVQLDLLK